MPDAKERRKGRGDHGLGGASTDPDTSPGADGSDPNPANGAEGDAYEDNWYRSLKAFAAARQTFGDEPDADADDEVDAGSDEDEASAIELAPDETPAAAAESPGATPTVGLLGRITDIDGCIERLTSPDPMERLRGVEELGAIGGPRAVESLVGSLSDPESNIRVRSLQLLGDLGDDRAGSAIEYSARTDPVAEVATAAEDALQRLANADTAHP
jgi:hypothetical protein